MQDNQHNISEDFVEKSWQEMRTVLDREMPVQVQRPWWLFALVFLIIAATAGILLWPGDQKSNRSPLDMADKSLLPTDEAASEKENNVSLYEANSDKINAEESAQNVKEEDRNSLILQTGPENTLLVEKNEMPAKPQKAESDDQPLIQSAEADFSGEEAIVNSNKNLSDAHSDNTILDASENGSQLRVDRPLISISFLESIAYKELKYSDIAPLHLNEKLIVQPIEPAYCDGPLSKLQFGIFASALSRNIRDISGFEAGVSLNYRWHKSWFLSTSLGYSHQRYTVSEQEVLDAAADFGQEMDTSAVSGSPYFDLSYSSAGDLLERTDHLFIDLSVNYRLSRNIFVGLGGRASRLLSSRNKALYINSSSLNAVAIDINTNYLSENEHLSRLDLGITGNVEYMVYPGIALKFQYHHGMGDLLKRSSFASTATQGVNGSARYRRFLLLGVQAQF